MSLNCRVPIQNGRRADGGGTALYLKTIGRSYSGHRGAGRFASGGGGNKDTPRPPPAKNSRGFAPPCARNSRGSEPKVKLPSDGNLAKISLSFFTKRHKFEAKCSLLN